MKVRGAAPRRKGWLLTAVVVYALGLLVPLFMSASAQADQSNNGYVFVYPQDPQQVQSMNDAIKQDRPDLSNPALSQSYVLNTDPFWGASPFRKFSFDASDQQDPNQNHVFAFTTSYDCQNGNVSSDPPANGGYVQIQLSALVKLDDGFWHNQPHDTVFAIKHFTSYTSSQAQPGTPSGSVVQNDWDVNEIYSNGHLQEIDNNYAGCFPAGYPGLRGSQQAHRQIRNLNDPAVPIATWVGAQEAVANQVDATNINNNSPAGGNDDVNACANVSFGLGWFLCPVIELANNTIGSLFHDIVINSLKTEPLNADDGGYGHSLYVVWQNVRAVADVGFVLIFMVIIFANLLGFELDAYAIKTMIPKLVAAAVLVQFSFVICAAILDLGNILGQGVASLLYTTAGHGANLGGGDVFDSIIGVILITLVAIVAVAKVGALALVPIVIVAIAAILGTLAVVFTLIVRKIIIALVVVFSPLAFVAFVLPGTEKLFRTWLQNFIRVVMMYPIISALFAIGALLASVTSHTSSSDVSLLNIQQLIAAAFPIIVFFLIPLTFRWAGGFMNYTYGEFTKFSSRGSKAAASKINSSQGVQTLRGLRASNKRAKLAENDTRGGLRGYTAGVRLRGDVFGKNRTPKLGPKSGATGWKRFAPVSLDKNPSMRRAQIRQQLQHRDEDLAARMEVDEDVLRNLQQPVLKNPMGASRGEIENAIVAMAAQRKKYKFNDKNALPLLHRAMKKAGYDDEEIYQANDFIVGQDYPGFASTNPAAAMTRKPGTEYLDTVEVPTYKRDEKGRYARKADGSLEQTGTRSTKVVGEDAFFVGQMKDAKTEKLLTGLNAQGIEELIDTKIRTASGDVAAIDYILEHKPDMIDAAKNDPRIFNNISGAVVTRIAEHARQRLIDRYGAAVRAANPNVTYDELVTQVKAAAAPSEKALVEAAEFDVTSAPAPSGGGAAAAGGATGGGGGGTGGGGTGGGAGGGSPRPAGGPAPAGGGGAPGYNRTFPTGSRPGTSSSTGQAEPEGLDDLGAGT